MTIKNILLLNPPSGLYRRDDRCQSRVEDQSVRVVLPPMDLALLAACVRRAGAKAHIRDYPAMGREWDALEQDLAQLAPDAVLFDVTTATLDKDLEVARMARRRLPGCRTIARGEVFDRRGEEILKETPELDMALCGEPELEIEKLAAGTDAPEIRAAIWRGEDGAIHRNGERAFVEDLADLPLPARDLLDNALYLSPESGRPLTVIKANRGCFAHCVFCPAGAISGYKLRVRPVESIIEELKECVEKYGIRDFLFDGDTFTAKKSWLLDLCRRINEEKLDIRWGCNSRVDTMDEERARALKDAGCILVAFGVESGDDAMLEKMRKGTTTDQTRRAVAACKAAGLATHAFFIIGLPWETRESLEKTYRFAREIDTDLVDINLATPLPGTEFYDIAMVEGLLDSDAARDGSYARASVGSKTLSAEYLTKWRKRALLKLYARPSLVIRTLARARREGLLKHYLRAAWHRLGSLVKG